jgi:hypothetical protein
MYMLMLLVRTSACIVVAGAAIALLRVANTTGYASVATYLWSLLLHWCYCSIILTITVVVGRIGVDSMSLLVLVMLMLVLCINGRGRVCSARSDTSREDVYIR